MGRERGTTRFVTQAGVDFRTVHTENAHETARRPEGVDDRTVVAVGKVTEALEWVERARGHLYEFHQLMGHADLTLWRALTELDSAAHFALAQDIGTGVLGRNVPYGRWSFQIVEEFDDGYYARDHFCRGTGSQ